MLPRASISATRTHRSQRNQGGDFRRGVRRRQQGSSLRIVCPQRRARSEGSRNGFLNSRCSIVSAGETPAGKPFSRACRKTGGRPSAPRQNSRSDSNALVTATAVRGGGNLPESPASGRTGDATFKGTTPPVTSPHKYRLTICDGNVIWSRSQNSRSGKSITFNIT